MALAHRLVLTALAVLAPLAALACRYSVRDTGFVDLDQPPWSLRLTGVPQPLHDLWRQAASSRLFDSNLRLESFVPGADPSVAPTLSLLDPERRAFPLAAGADLPSEPAAIAAFLEGLAGSPVRDQLHDQLLRAFAVFFLIEGTKADRNDTARRAAEAAIRAFTPRLASLPKPVETPPQLVVLSPQRLASERLLVWSLGFHPEPADEPRLAVLYGRGRSMGPSLEGPLITRTTLEQRLTLIGQDCECDLDRSWLQGPVFPARWDAARQATAARLLGFDPENPLVRTEVSRIVFRGPLPGQARRAATSDLDTLDLGYREEAVELADADLDNDRGTGIELDTDAGTESATDGVTTVAAPGVSASTPAPTPGAAGTSPVPPETRPRSVLALWLAFSGTAFAVLVLGAFFLTRAFRKR